MKLDCKKSGGGLSSLLRILSRSLSIGQNRKKISKIILDRIFRVESFLAANISSSLIFDHDKQLINSKSVKKITNSKIRWL